MFIVISYDIVDDRQRLKVSRVLSDYGQRVQKSVFECDLNDRRFFQLKKEIEKLIDQKEDSVRYYLLCERCRQRVKMSGWGMVREEEGVVLV